MQCIGSDFSCSSLGNQRQPIASPSVSLLFGKAAGGTRQGAVVRYEDFLPTPVPTVGQNVKCAFSGVWSCAKHISSTKHTGIG